MSKSWMIVCGALVASLAFADDDKDVKVTGSLDGYYQWNLQNVPGDLSVRPYDGKVKELTLNTARLQATRAARGKQFGFTVDLTVGKFPDALNAAEPGGRDKFKTFEQAFITLPMGESTLDIGKFNTPIGFESVDVTQNNNYSRSFTAALGQPFYHTGLKYNTKLGSMPAQFYVVTGWNEVADSNGSPSAGIRLDKNVTAKLSVSGNFYYGQEGRGTPASQNNQSFGGIGFATPGERTVDFFNLNGTYVVSGQTTLGFDAEYGNALSGKASSLKWSGLAGYAKFQVDPKTAIALRSEIFRDSDGAFTGIGQDLSETTLTLSYDVIKNGKLLLEWRGDRSSQAIFNAGSSTKKYRDSILAGFELKF